MNQWLDILKRLNENTLYWPGDTQYSNRLNSSMAKGSTVTVGENGRKSYLYIGTATVVDAAEALA
ncbi:hypothetical protein AB4X15_05385 [Peribacillus simplex]|uniref:hypothetical protein n=1 Tax=Peribacillus simplex TaxID=1478 RepID=UPI0034E84758